MATCTSFSNDLDNLNYPSCSFPDILNGDIGFVNNNLLCHARTIDWTDNLGPINKTVSIISDNPYFVAKCKYVPKGPFFIPNSLRLAGYGSAGMTFWPWPATHCSRRGFDNMDRLRIPYLYLLKKNVIIAFYANYNFFFNLIGSAICHVISVFCLLCFSYLGSP
jgi:hypothetical protein